MEENNLNENLYNLIVNISFDKNSGNENHSYLQSILNSSRFNLVSIIKSNNSVKAYIRIKENLQEANNLRNIFNFFADISNSVINYDFTTSKSENIWWSEPEDIEKYLGHRACF